MNKHTLITLIAIIAIVIPFVYSGMNIYAAEKLQYRWSEPEKFNYFALSNNGQVEFCNTIPFYANFKKVQINTIYDLENKGTFVVEPLNINPSTTITQKGIFSSSEINLAQYLFMQMDFQYDGGEIRLDPNKMSVIVNIDTPIIGVIPYSTTMQYTGFDFDKIMSGKNFDC